MPYSSAFRLLPASQVTSGNVSDDENRAICATNLRLCVLNSINTASNTFQIVSMFQL